MVALRKGLLSFLSGLGFMGLGFYILFFTFIEMKYRVFGNYILLFSILTSILACLVVYFLSIAFSFSQIQLPLKVSSTVGGFIGGLLAMIAIVIMILSFQVNNLNLMDETSLFETLHPTVTFFLAAACTILILWPDEPYRENYADTRL